MDAYMGQYGGLPPDAPFGSLHDDLLNGVHAAGLGDFAAQIGIIDANGELADVRVQEGWDAIAEGGPEFSYPVPMQEPQEIKPSPAAIQQGNRLLEAANAAAARALATSQAVRQRMQQAADDEKAGIVSPRDDSNISGAPAQTPPSKAGRKISGRQSRAGSAGDQNASARTNGKGSRHFSMKALANQVCEKVESKVRTTYNEVADELVSEFGNVEGTGSPGGTQYDEKNIRRRVYDALNVLIAMEIISRQKKEILWHGLPVGHGHGVERANTEKAKLTAEIEKKQDYLQELLKTQTALHNLIQRNRDVPASVLVARNQAGQPGPHPLQLPFILIQAQSDCHVEIQISDDSRHAQFDFHSTPFKIHGDDVVIRHMGLQLNPPQPPPLLAVGSPADVKPLQAQHRQPPSDLQPTPSMAEVTPPQLQLQMEADQQLAALQGYSQMPAQPRWPASMPPGFQPLHSGQMNGFSSPDTHMGSQSNGSLDVAPAARRQAIAHGLPATPKSQTLSPALGMAPSPGTLLPHLPLHAHHMAQASLINSPQGGSSGWQYAQSNGANGHHHNVLPQAMLTNDLFVPPPAAGQKLHHSKAAAPASATSHEAAMWGARYDM